MSAAIVIDSVEFARGRRRLSGGLPVSGLIRISDVLSDSKGIIDYSLAGTNDGKGQLQLKLQVTGMLHLRCQRCLEPMDYRVDIANTLDLAFPGSPVETDDAVSDVIDAPDYVEASPELDVAELIEDEILLCLPAHPRHADEKCVSKLSAYETERKGDSKFAGLAVLKNLGKLAKE